MDKPGRGTKITTRTRAKTLVIFLSEGLIELARALQNVCLDDLDQMVVISPREMKSFSELQNPFLDVRNDLSKSFVRTFPSSHRNVSAPTN
ncbi:MAG: hypothetical protein HY966_02410 [Ignavibacteriales bacterium]|nr:hypothetical protein [Ignavibacteriales bacterium]